MPISFFEKVDSTRVIERHIRKINGIEMVQARILIKEYQKARLEIRERLETTLSGTFTEAKLKIALAQIEGALLILQQRLKNEINEGSIIATEEGVNDLRKEISFFEKRFRGVTQEIPLHLVQASLIPQTYLINQYESSMQSYNESLRANIQRELTQALIQRKGLSQAIGDIQDVMIAEEWKIARIARTELHNIYNLSKISGMNELSETFMPDLKKTLIHPMDTRTGKDSKILAKLNPVIPINQAFKYAFMEGKQTITRTFMAPPDRPNDRAILVPYREKWDENK